MKMDFAMRSASGSEASDACGDLREDVGSGTEISTRSFRSAGSQAFSFTVTFNAGKVPEWTFSIVNSPLSG